MKYSGVRLGIVVIVNLVLTVLLMELALRMIPIPGFTRYLEAVAMITGQRDSFVRDPIGDMPVFAPNRRFKWQTMDGDFTISTIPFPDSPSLGLRDDGLSIDARHKVFACGDSFTFGFGVDDQNVWHEVLERRYEGSVDIFNLRFIGNSVSHILQKYPSYKDRFTHDTVFLGIYLGNEFLDCALSGMDSGVMEDKGEAKVAGGEETMHRDLLGTFYGFVRNNSYTARLAKYLLFKRLINIGYYKYDVKREVYQPEGSPFVFTIDYEENILVRTCEKGYDPVLIRGVEVFNRDLTSLVNIIRADDKRIFVFLFPFKEQVYWDQWAFRIKHPERYDRFFVNKIARRALDRLEVDYYDLTDDMIASDEAELYWSIDSHWNVEGNHLVSNLIYSYLAKRGFP